MRGGAGLFVLLSEGPASDIQYRQGASALGMLKDGGEGECLQALLRPALQVSSRAGRGTRASDHTWYRNFTFHFLVVSCMVYMRFPENPTLFKPSRVNLVLRAMLCSVAVSVAFLQMYVSGYLFV